LKREWNLIIDPYNTNLLKKHILCASYEIPIHKFDDFFFDDEIDLLIKENKLKDIEGRLIPSISDMPHKYVTLRSFEEDDFVLFDEMVKNLRE